jgi:hypothetical protein
MSAEKPQPVFSPCIFRQLSYTIVIFISTP